MKPNKIPDTSSRTNWMLTTRLGVLLWMVLLASSCLPWVPRTPGLDGASVPTSSEASRSVVYAAAVRVLFRHDYGIHSRDETAGTVETSELHARADGVGDLVYFRIRILADHGSVAVRLTDCKKGIRGFIVEDCKEGYVFKELITIHDAIVRDIHKEVEQELSARESDN